MSLLQDEAGLIALLLGAVLLGIVVIVAASVLRGRQAMPPAHRVDARLDAPLNARRVDPMLDAPGIVAHVAATAPTDAHMSLGVIVEAVRRRLRRLVGL